MLHDIRAHVMLILMDYNNWISSYMNNFWYMEHTIYVPIISGGRYHEWKKLREEHERPVTELYTQQFSEQLTEQLTEQFTEFIKGLFKEQLTLVKGWHHVSERTVICRLLQVAVFRCIYHYVLYQNILPACTYNNIKYKR